MWTITPKSPQGAGGQMKRKQLEEKDGAAGGEHMAAGNLGYMVGLGQPGLWAEGAGLKSKYRLLCECCLD